MQHAGLLPPGASCKLAAPHHTWPYHTPLPPPTHTHLRRLQRHLYVAALQGQAEARALVRHKVQRHLGVALGLCVRVCVCVCVCV